MRTLTIIIFLILLLPSVLAVEFEFTKGSNNFSQGETLIAKVSGNFVDPVTSSNVFFYRNHVRIPMVSDITKIEGEFYIYALLTGKSPGNYSIALEDVRYMSGTEISEEDLIKNFTITEDLADFSVNPGFVNTFEDFSLELQNLQEDSITIQVDTSENLETSSSLNLKSGEIKKIDFELTEQGTFTENISLVSENTNYQIPIFIFSNQTEEEGEREFELQPKTFSVSMATESDTKRIIYLVNTGDETIEDIILFASPLLDPYVTLFPETINDLEKNSTEKVEIQIISDIEEAIIEGDIIVQAENLTTSSKLIIEFIKDYIPPEGEGTQDGEVIITTCEQLEGEICGENQECTGETVSARDGVCCLAQCQEIEKSSTGKIIGWSLIILLVLLLYWFYKKKYKGVKRKSFLGKKK